ncbi:MAG: acetyl-CoA decarbonylase/synthase complex subunit gamma [Candidatus Omnitrophica bacterium]|nr:acetyl-CoA decarbonylase/synthase complex subunit gamma [Candidatus Omnitrophota bacterium]MCM8793734.1 acetyl-CoA decarbonylase/synthase complex subunit gamma [Candidatus Omnitrophota bacterium]
MALSALDIYKLLPKTNCKKCGSPTCLAFAMRLLAKKGSLEECPYVSEEARRILSEAAEPPIRTIVVGKKERKIELGGETVLFRHEKTFYHPSAVAIALADTLSEEEIEKKITAISALGFERVAQELKPEMLALFQTSTDKQKFLSLTEKVVKNSSLGIILISPHLPVLKEAMEVCRVVKPIVYLTSPVKTGELLDLVKKDTLPLVIKGENLEATLKLSEEIMAKGYKELILDVSGNNMRESLENLTILRRLAILKNFRPAGFPLLCFTQSKNKEQAVLEAGTYIAKYASIVVVDFLAREAHLSLLTLRQNIFTDPQKPVTVEPKLYEIGLPNRDSPLLVTTNFSLTFYTVSPEIENSKVPAYLLVTDTEGMSVLTAWAAEKFTAEAIAKAMKAQDVENKLSHRRVIIPGYVAVLSGKLEEETGWQVIVGPKEASGIPKFLRQLVWV